MHNVNTCQTDDIQGGQMTAVVIGGTPTALGVIRSLADAGVAVIAISEDFRVPSAATWLCREKIQCNTGNPVELIETLVKVGDRLGRPAALFPCGDTDVLTVSAASARLSSYYRFLLPAHSRLQTLMDKTLFYRFAVDQGLPISRTYWIDSSDRARSVGQVVKFPCILKPPRNTVEWERVMPGRKVVWINSAAELVEQYECVAAVQRQVVVQEWIDGGDDDVYFVLAYCDRAGEPLVHFCGRKIRQWPPLLGSTACACPHSDPGLVKRTLDLLRQWEVPGLASIEWKHDRRTNEYFIIEPTVGRCDLQSPVALLANLNLPYMACLNMLGMPLPQVDTRVQKGCWIHEERELYAVRYGMRAGQLTLRGWLQSVRGRRVWVYWSPRDPMPLFSLLGTWVRRCLVKLVKSLNVKKKQMSTTV